MKFVLDTLQLILQYQVHEEGSVVNHPSYVIVDTYAVRDKRCNVHNRFFYHSEQWTSYYKSILNISKNCDGALLQFGDIITINQYTTVVTKEQYIIVIGDFYVKHSRVNEPKGFPNGSPSMLILLKIQSHSNPTIKYGSPSVLKSQNTCPLKMWRRTQLLIIG